MGKCSKWRGTVTEVSLLSYQELLAVERSSPSAVPPPYRDHSIMEPCSLNETVLMTIVSCQGAPTMRPVNHFVLYMKSLYNSNVALTD